jgi:hypothetical protein
MYIALISDTAYPLHVFTFLQRDVDKSEYKLFSTTTLQNMLHYLGSVGGNSTAGILTFAF